MKLTKLFLRCLRRTARSRPTRVPPARRHALRLHVESLGDRTVPSAFTAASVSDLIADINAANLAGGSNTITLAPGTTFSLTAVNNYTDLRNGLPVIAANDNLTVVGNDDTIERSAGGPTLPFRLFDVAVGASLTLENLTLQNGLATGPAGVGRGGAVYNHGTLILDSVTLLNNTARGSDGLLLRGSTPGGGAPGAGGGIYSNGALTVRGCTIANNAAIGGGAAGGGSPFWPANGGNGFGGGLYVAGGSVSVTDSSVTGNIAQGGYGNSTGKPGQGVGGGLYIDPSAVVALDAFTVDHVLANHASTSDNDIHGSYSVIP